MSRILKTATKKSSTSDESDGIANWSKYLARKALEQESDFEEKAFNALTQKYIMEMCVAILELVKIITRNINNDEGPTKGKISIECPATSKKHAKSNKKNDAKNDDEIPHRKLPYLLQAVVSNDTAEKVVSASFHEVHYGLFYEGIDGKAKKSWVNRLRKYGYGRIFRHFQHFAACRGLYLYDASRIKGSTTNNIYIWLSAEPMPEKFLEYGGYWHGFETVPEEEIDVIESARSSNRPKLPKLLDLKFDENLEPIVNEEPKKHKGKKIAKRPSKRAAEESESESESESNSDESVTRNHLSNEAKGLWGAEHDDEDDDEDEDEEEDSEEEQVKPKRGKKAAKPPVEEDDDDASSSDEDEADV